ncbi:MAG: hypothetical protein EOO42_22015 [Flavobacteriales bacterium]|nr:MAG: hypothetical protein EOO42_22015 [Flavobacteriales bacterium]
MRTESDGEVPEIIAIESDGGVPVTIAIMIIHNDSAQPAPSTMKWKIFYDEDEAKEFLYQLCLINLKINNYDTDDEADNDNDQDKIKQEAIKRKLLKEIVFDEEYQKGDPEYDNLFKGQFLKYVLEYELESLWVDCDC